MVHRGGIVALLGVVLALAPSPARATVEGVLALEAGPELFGGEYYASLAPAFSLDAGFLSFELQAPLRLRMNGALAQEKGVVRREDWDALSDVGRALRSFDVTLGERTFVAHLGTLAHRTLGHGTIVDDYSNSLVPDAQPLGLWARLSVGPVAAEAVAGDVLGLDLTAATLSLEPLSLGQSVNDRMHVTASCALDWQAQAMSAKRFAVFGASVDGAVLRTSAVKLSPYGDLNTTNHGGHGLHLGLLADFSVSVVEFSLRGEYRHTRGPYQPQYFDLGYSLERGAALVEPMSADASLAKADLPYGTNDSWRAGARLRMGPVSFSGDLASRGRDPFTGSVIHDASGVLEIEAGSVTVAAFAAARQFSWGHNPARVLALGEARYRITPFLHAWTIAGREYQWSDSPPVAVWQLGGGIGGALGF